MDPCPFVRILIGDLTLKFPSVSKPSFSTVHPSSSPCFCKIKLTNFPYQFSAVPLVLPAGSQPDPNSRAHSLNACFNLSKPQIEALASKKPSLSISIYTGRRGATCGLNSAKLLGRVTVPLAELATAETRPLVYQNGWIGIGGKKNGSGQSQFFLSVRAEPDPRFVFKFDGEPECSPQVFQVQGNVKQPVFTCKFGFRNASDMQSRSPSLVRWLPGLGSPPWLVRRWVCRSGAACEVVGGLRGTTSEIGIRNSGDAADRGWIFEGWWLGWCGRRIAGGFSTATEAGVPLELGWV